MIKDTVQKVCEYIKRSPSCFHAVDELRKELEESGFTELREEERWKLEGGGKYFVRRNHSSIISFVVPEISASVGELHMIATHSDSPTFKIKPDPEMKSAGGTIRLNIEGYGGMLCSTWFDRPLGIAGRLFLRDKEEGITEKLISFDRDALIIPSLAIHMNRTANSEQSINIQKDMPPLWALATGEESSASLTFSEWLAENCGIGKDRAADIIGSDLYLVNRSEPVIWGVNKEFLSAPKLDDLECCYSSFLGFLDAAARYDSLKCAADREGGCENREKGDDSIMMMHCVFDNEETGSMSRQGAQSTFLSDTLVRIAEALDWSAGDLRRILAKSLMVSADNAHAVHPNNPDKADPVCRPEMNKGIVVKYHANQKYTTDGASGAIFTWLCEENKIPWQKFVNRADMAGGSTLGNISNTQVSVRSVDIGLAQLAMHSSYETAGSKDPEYLETFAENFYKTKIPEIR
uniref:M18 family aminopeptidase n=1 Tax=Eubacterium cellulosolvens TaxID=29322 RepID=UPI0004825C49|nr:M18 family aminopeptidase [[Eubacterium] cellulosolvens]